MLLLLKRSNFIKFLMLKITLPHKINLQSNVSRCLYFLSGIILFTGTLLKVIQYLQNRSLYIHEANLARNYIEKSFVQLFNPNGLIFYTFLLKYFFIPYSMLLLCTLYDALTDSKNNMFSVTNRGNISCNLSKSIFDL